MLAHNLKEEFDLHCFVYIYMHTLDLWRQSFHVFTIIAQMKRECSGHFMMYQILR